MPKIIDAVRRVLRGEVFLSPELLTVFLQRATTGKTLDNDPVAALTNRELQVFELIGHGLTTVEIAGKLQLSPKTVESHRKAIKVKLSLGSGAQLNRRAFQWAQENH
jgi:DNA-binding NarL/FixJ family response regulator